MSKLQILCFIFLLFNASFLSSAEQSTSTQENTLNNTSLSSYQLGSGDTIHISVFGEKELTQEIKLSDAGSISYPFLGELTIKGLTVGQLEEKIFNGLNGDYLINPKVTVKIIEYRQFFIQGEVKKPGSYPYLPGLTVRKAVSIAGGFTDYAKETEVGLIRENENDNKEVMINQDTVLMPGDMINVKESFF